MEKTIKTLVQKLIQNKIIDLAVRCRIFSTNHVARWFNEYSRPKEKALEFIKPFLTEGILESNKERRVGDTFLFRLTKKGRTLYNVPYHPVPFTGRKVHHWLAIVDIYLDMCDIERPYLFEPEMRLHDGKFNPDIFSIWSMGMSGKGKGIAMWIEMQRSPLTSQKWIAKWQPYNEYIKKKLYLNESWNPGNVRPRVVVVSSQMDDTIKSGNDFPIMVVRNIKELRIMT